MYEIYADDTLIYDSTLEDYKIGKGVITKEVDKAGSFVFSLYPDHPYYSDIAQLKTVITVYKSGRIVFRGRVLSHDVDHWNNKLFTCEGEMGFFQDTFITSYNYKGTPADMFYQLITGHNGRSEEFKRFKIGAITVPMPSSGEFHKESDAYATTWDNLTGPLLGETGGHLYVTHGDDGRDPMPTIHYLADFPNTASQPIEFGVNLKKYAQTVSAVDIATAIIPLGKSTEVKNSMDLPVNTPLTIADINGGVDYVYSPSGVTLYGWIFKTLELSDVEDPYELKRQAEAYLATLDRQAITVSLTAVDMHLLDRSIESYNVGEYVRTSSEAHGFTATMLCTQQTMDLLKPENDTVTLGHVFKAFTRANLQNSLSQAKISALQRRLNSLQSQSQETLTDIITRLEVLECGGGGGEPEEPPVYDITGTFTGLACSKSYVYDTPNSNVYTLDVTWTYYAKTKPGTLRLVLNHFSGAPVFMEGSAIEYLSVDGVNLSTANYTGAYDSSIGSYVIDITGASAGTYAVMLSYSGTTRLEWSIPVDIQA